jgi:outer membrane lipoprotein
MIKRFWVLVSLLLMVSACAHIPESLKVDEGVALTNFLDVRDGGEAHLGALARWGGVIAKVENNTDSTMLEIVHFQLKSSTRPQQKDQTQGRFRVYYQGFLDPIIFKEGRSVTAIGSVSSKEEGKIGEHEYAYPVLKAKDVHLWKEIKEVDVRVTHNPMWYTPSLWYHPRLLYRSPIHYPVSKSKKTPIKPSVQNK